jgi:hypothetical protein
MAAFLVAAEAKDYTTAGTLLDLSSLTPGARETRGPVLASSSTMSSSETSGSSSS